MMCLRICYVHFVASQHYSYRTIQVFEWYVIIHMENWIGDFVLVYAGMERMS